MLATINHCTAAKYKNKYGKVPVTQKKKSVYRVPVIVTLVSKLTQIAENKPKETNDLKKNKRHKCDVCDKAFGATNKLAIHTKTHTGEKPYICDWDDCNKAFKLPHHLKSHTKTHTGEKPYICDWDDCNKAFKLPHHLKSHTKTHTGEKPYKCSQCGKAFTQSGSCRRHINNFCSLGTAIREGL